MSNTFLNVCTFTSSVKQTRCIENNTLGTFKNIISPFMVISDSPYLTPCWTVLRGLKGLTHTYTSPSPKGVIMYE